MTFSPGYSLWKLRFERKLLIQSFLIWSSITLPTKITQWKWIITMHVWLKWIFEIWIVENVLGQNVYLCKIVPEYKMWESVSGKIISNLLKRTLDVSSHNIFRYDFKQKTTLLRFVWVSKTKLSCGDLVTEYHRKALFWRLNHIEVGLISD